MTSLARRPRALVALTAGVALTAAVSAVALTVLTGDGDDDAPELAASARAFVAAYERSRLSSYVVTTTFTRERAGSELTSARRRIAQRPPDRVETTDAGVTARVDGRRVGCVVGSEGELACREDPTPRPYEEVVAAEVARLQDQVLGPQRIYNVAEVSDGCFRLRLVRPIPAPPYGELAQLCFDAGTGALVESVVRRSGGVVDRVVATAVSGEVTDRDLVLPDEAGTGG